MESALLDELLFRAAAHLKHGNADQAGKVASLLVEEVEPKCAAAYEILSKVHRSSNGLPQAVLSAARALALEPENASLRKLFSDSLGALAISPSVVRAFAKGASLLMDRMRREGTSPPQSSLSNCVDLVLPMAAAHGSELNVIQVAKLIRTQTEVRIWSETVPAPALLDLDPTIRTITADEFPTGETLAIMGPYFRAGEWIRRTRPKRVILHFNVFAVVDLLWWLAAVSALPASRVDILFASRWLRDTLGVDGEVLPSPIDLTRFAPRPRISAVKTVGRMSRDNALKHHPADTALYRELLDRGLSVNLLGARSFAPFLPLHDRLKVYDAGVTDPVAFLHQLDLFLYRTGGVFESWGRVVIEAMACGLPVVCHKYGGYAEVIENGENGILFDHNDEALDAIKSLGGDSRALNRIGEGARATAQQLFSRQSTDRLASYFARL